MSEIGLYAIRLALLATIFGIGAGIYSGVTRRADWGQVAERSVYTVLTLLGVAMISLFWALGSNDFSLEYVARHSARSMSLGYRLGALWGGQAGSLLLWAFLLMAFGSAGDFSNRRSRLSHLGGLLCHPGTGGGQDPYGPLTGHPTIDSIPHARPSSQTGKKFASLVALAPGRG